MKINFKAVVLGVLADLGCWLIIFIPLLVLVILESAEVAVIWGSDAAYNDFMSSFPVATILFVCGVLSACVAGWTCASIARQDEIKHAVIAGVFSIIVFLWLWFAIPTEEPLKSYEIAYTLVGYVLVIPAYIIGAKKRARRGYSVKTELPTNQPPIPEP